MNDFAIRAENLSKRYRIGDRKIRDKRLHTSLAKTLTLPLRRMHSVVRGQSTVVSDTTIWALRDVSFEVARGEIVGVVGRNGAGKSTLFKILSRITNPTEGQCEIRGRVGTILHSGIGFNKEMTGRENIYLNGIILGMKKADIDRRFDEIVAFSEIEKFIDTPVKRYSSGMKGRLGFSVVAHTDAEILFFDEVLATGDLAFKKKCFAHMERLAKEGRTILITTQKVNKLKSLCDRCLYLKEGRLEGLGPADEIVDRYLEDLFGQSPESDLPAKFNEKVPNPVIRLTEVNLSGGIHSQDTAIFETGDPLTLACSLESVENVPEAVVDIRCYRDGDIVFRTNSKKALGVFSINSGEKKSVSIDFDALWLTPGRYTIVLFVVPVQSSQIKDTLSEFGKLNFIVQGTEKRGVGYVYLDNSWKLE